jgi:hypothetical protein
MPKALQVREASEAAQFTCFTGTKVQILMLKALQVREASEAAAQIRNGIKEGAARFSVCSIH